MLRYKSRKQSIEKSRRKGREHSLGQVKGQKIEHRADLRAEHTKEQRIEQRAYVLFSDLLYVRSCAHIDRSFLATA